MKRILIIAALLIAVSTWGQTNGTVGFNTTGNDLIEACRPGNALELLGCYSYIHGALNGIVTGQITLHHGGMSHLPQIPDGVTNGELTKVVLAYIDKHPEMLHESASYLVFKAVTEAWGFSKPMPLMR
jgi:hypothetical protein